MERFQYFTDPDHVQGHDLRGPAGLIDAKALLDRHVAMPETVDLGPVVVRTDIQSIERSPEGLPEPAVFNVLHEYQTQYPEVVTRAIGSLYAEYNHAFRPPVAANREWPTDYQHAIAQDGTPINGWVQIDMVGLPQGFLDAAANMPEETVREVLRGRIFEIENSLAMYQLLQRIFRRDGEPTRFEREFRASLEVVRRRFDKRIALLAVTDPKHQAMREEEFGKYPGEQLTDDEVYELSGFDKMFGPEEFAQHVTETGGKLDYVLYARTSDPKIKLIRPETPVSIPLLRDPHTRQIIRAHAVTFNVDDPTWPTGDPRKINDTKAWMPAVGMAYPIYRKDDLFSEEFGRYLLSQGVAPEMIESGAVRLRAKPMQASYGGYGHQRAELRSRKFRDDVKRDLSRRGPYVVQPELQTPIITNASTGETYTYIDRNFFYIDTQGQPQFMGGFRSLMPRQTQEAERGRVHGNRNTVWAEII